MVVTRISIRTLMKDHNSIWFVRRAIDTSNAVQTMGVSTYVGNQGYAHPKSLKADALATCSECILDFSSVET